MSRRRRARILVIGGLCLAAVVGLLVRSGAGSRAKRRHRAARAVQKAPAVVPVATASRTSRPEPSPAVLSPEAARKARADAIRETMEVIREECRRNAGGDWERWSAQLAPLRDDLLKKVR